MTRARPLSALCLCALLLCGTSPLAAQTARGEALSLGVNALLGGATAGVRAHLRGGSFLDAFAAGAAGGALTYAGKRIAVEDFAGAGFLGREVAAVGSSVSANAAEGRGVLERVALPLGPVRLYISPRGEGPLLQPRVDLAAVASVAWAAAQPGSRLDLEESLSSGAPVFRRRVPAQELGFEGAHLAGVVQLRDAGDPERVRRAAAHERVHVLQYDQAFLLWAAPAEEWLLNRARWSRALHRWVDLGVNAPALAALGAALPYRSRPWEQEAELLGPTVGPTTN
jgi:hypothetical protein